jgi:hypothetical protein
MRPLRVAAILLLAAAAAGPLLAYTIYLKDGSRLIAREKYRVEDGRAIIVLQNGTQTFIEASEIDVARTEKANQGSYGTAFVIDDQGNVVDAPVSPAEKKQSLVDMAAGAGPKASTRSRATRPAPESAAGTKYPRTGAGFVDLTVFPRAPYRNLDVAVEASRFLRALGIGEFKVFQGTGPGRAFVEMTTNSEASVFRGLQAAADTLIHLRNKYPQLVSELELLMTTSSRERAGQFVIDTEAATQLAEKNMDPATFFIENVQF